MDLPKPHGTSTRGTPKQARILMASSSYPTSSQDWRGSFIRSLTEALSARHDTLLSVWHPRGPVPENVREAMTDDDARWLERLSSSGGIAHQIRKGRAGAVLLPIQLLARLRRMYERESQHDLVHANWLQLALPLPSDRRPLLCTALGSDVKLLRVPGMVPLLRRVFENRKTTICPNADWMVPILEKAFGDVARVRFVAFGIDSMYFDVRRNPPSPPRWLCVSRVTRGKIGDLFDWAGPHFEGKQRTLHLLGPMQEALKLPQWVHYHGPTNPTNLARDWLPNATGLITLSRHPEGRPQVVVEALASGLPVLASNLPAHREILEASAGGLIANSAREFESMLIRLEGAEGLERGATGREWVRQSVGTWSDCAASYSAIYRELLGWQESPCGV